MARFTDEFITKIKTETDFLRLVANQGYALKKHGSKNTVIACPFHADKTPSLVISPDTNLFHCFGCGAAGSVIDWVMKTQKVSFRQAVDKLTSDPSFSALAANADLKANPKPVVVSSTADHQELLQHVMGFYQQTLKQSPEALAYLSRRGLNHPDLIDGFKLGYANRTLGYKLARRTCQEGIKQRANLTEVGLFRDSGHEHFNGCVVMPIFDDHGQITEVYGRKINCKSRATSLEHLYLPGAHRGIWNSACLAACSESEIILCESVIDAMTFWVNGFRNVTASYGTGGFTPDHLAAFKQHQIKRVLIAYDRDEAGELATAKLAPVLMNEGFEVFRVLFPQGLDANEFAQQASSVVESLGMVIRQAQWLGKGQAPERQLSLAISAGLVDHDTGEILAVPANAGATPVVPVVESVQATPEKPAEITYTPEVDPVPDMPSLAAEEGDKEITIKLGELVYRVRGLEKNGSAEQLKINLLAKRGDHFHVDNLDLYAARARFSFIKQAGLELSMDEAVIKADLGKILVYLESRQAQLAQEKLAESQNQAVSLSDADRKAALGLLQDPDLLNRILADFDACGVIGEQTNKLVSYLATVSRKLDKPLAVMIQSSSAAGKSALMDAVLNMIPKEERVQFSAMTGQSLFYMGETNLKHKILAISEEEGADQASYALKLLQSEGEVSIASTGKNAATGNLETQQYRVEGPVMLFMTTTAIDIDEELMNRCLVLSVNESKEQTEAIHRKQRYAQTLEGVLQRQTAQGVERLHQNAQRLLRPLLVANPYAEQLTFLSDKTRARRDHMKYLTLINTVALLHQHQRPIQRIVHNGQSLEYIEVTPSDIETANKITHEVLGRSLDELPPQTRQLLSTIYTMVADECQAQQLKIADYRFSRKTVREYCHWGNTQLKIHLMRLEEMEYLLIHKGGRGQAIVYELLYQGEGEAGRRFVHGLISPEDLLYDRKQSGVNEKRSEACRPQVGGVSVASRFADHQVNQGLAADLAKLAENALIEGKQKQSPNRSVERRTAGGI